MDCPRCNAPQDDEARFCNACGVAMPAQAPPAPAAGPQTPVTTTPAAPPARSGVPGWLIGCLIALVVVLLVVVIVGGVLINRELTRRSEPIMDSPGAADGIGEETPREVSPRLPSVEPARDDDAGVAEAEAKYAARAVVDQYLEAERNRNSPEMATYLTGQAAAEFDATQTAHDTEIQSVEVIYSRAESAETVIFDVLMQAADLESGESYEMSITYRVVETEDGWRISTITYNE
ncbi:MAG TPA: hypothetical protein DGT21_05335 [Armatimonadetes bacterium]|nr:hypothetical protein [Armatimonadota bacterium]